MYHWYRFPHLRSPILNKRGRKGLEDDIKFHEGLRAALNVYMELSIEETNFIFPY